MVFSSPRPVLIVLSLVSAAVLLGAPSTAGETADDIPADGAITVDGYLHVAEWNEGADQPVDDEGWVRMQRRDDGLYLAVRTNQVAMVDVFVHRGDELHQLHASGQVGGALFERGEDQLWHLEHSYPWIGEDAKPREAKNDMRDRLRSRLSAKGPKPARGSLSAPEPPPMPPTDPPPAPDAAPDAPKAPPEMPPEPRALPKPERDSAEDIAVVAKHLEDHGWTATLLNMGGPTTAELFLSNDFLRPW